MIDELRKNIETEIGMLRELSSYIARLEYSTEEEAKLLNGAINSLRASMGILNDSIPGILEEMSIAKKLPSYIEKKSQSSNLENISFKRTMGEIDVVLRKSDKEKFLRELDINEQFVRKIKIRDREAKEKYIEFQASRGYLKLANKLFLKTAKNYTKKGSFKELALALRRANINILFETYVASIFLSVLLSFILSVLVFFFLLFFDTSPLWPFFELRTGEYLIRLSRIFWIPIGIPLLVFLSLYYYPYTEKKSIGKRIDRELPFAVIHMSAISGSGIQPSEIFKIIGLSNEYPFLRKEIRKVVNQINLYGYDLTTALDNASRTAPSENLAELFSGLSTTITSGANLPEFFEKRAETLLLGYRLEREKYTRLVETFLDIYISIVIAAPMIFLLLLIMMAISGIGIGFGPFQLSVLAVLTIALLNTIFLIFLHIKQPSY